MPRAGKELNMKAKHFDGLLQSEIRKAESAANKATGTKNCKLTGYSYKVVHPFDFDPDAVFVEVMCEMCHDYERRASVDVRLDIPMFDRRRTVATAV